MLYKGINVGLSFDYVAIAYALQSMTEQNKILWRNDSLPIKCRVA